MSESNQRKLGAVLSYVSIIVNTLIQLLFTPFLLRTLGQSEYGLYSLVASIIGYLTIMDLGFGNAIIVYTSKYRAQGKVEEEKKLHGMFNLVFKIIGIISVLVGLVLFFNVDGIFGSKMTELELSKMKIMMLILTFNLFLSFCFAIYNSIVTAYEKFVFQKILAIIQSLLKPALMIPLLFMGYKSISLCIIITIANVITILSNFIYCKKKLKVDTRFQGFDKKIFKVVIGYSIWIFIGVIVDKINWSVDNFVLGAVSGTIAVSVYSVASILNQLFVTLSTAISGVLLPKMSKMIAKNASNEKITNEFIKVGRIQYYIIFLMCTGLIIFGKQFIRLWVGAKYSESYYVALILIIPVCIPLIQNLGISILQATNKYKFRSILLLIMAIINIGISIFLAKLYGPIGAAIGTGLSLVLCNGLIMNIYYYKSIKLDVIKFWKNIIFMTTKLLIPLAVVIFLIYITNFSNLLDVLVLIPFYCILYSVICYFFVMNDYEKSIVNNILYKLRGNKHENN